MHYYIIHIRHIMIWAKQVFRFTSVFKGKGEKEEEKEEMNKNKIHFLLKPI